MKRDSRALLILAIVLLLLPVLYVGSYLQIDRKVRPVAREDLPHYGGATQLETPDLAPP